LTTSYPRWQGDPSGDFVLQLVENLAADSNVEINVIAPADLNSSSSEKKGNVAVHRCRYFWPASMQKLAYGDGIPWNLKHSFIAWLNIPFLLTSIISRMMMCVSKSDIIHANWGILGAVAAMLRCLHHKPVVVMIHGTDLSSKNKLITSVTKWAIKKCDAVIVNCTENYEICTKLRNGTSRLYYINNGVRYPSDTELAEFRNKNKKPNDFINILSAGRLIPERRYDLLLKAFAEVHSRNKNIFLTLLGDGPEFQNLKTLALQLDIAAYINFQGRVSHEDVFNFMAWADIYISATTVETHGSSIAEAAAFGLPVVVTKVGFPAELVLDGQTGFVVEPGNETAMTQAMEKLVQDSQMRKKAAQAMRMRIEELGLTWKQCAQKTMKVYGDMKNYE
jgi:glycosyltransferase involved in cell wall biosynthesis